MNAERSTNADAFASPDVFAGVDLGGTSIKAAIANSQGVIQCRRVIPTQSEKGPRDVLRRIAALIKSMLSESNGGSSVQGFGMGVPGLVNLQTGHTRFLPNFPTQWRGVPVSQWLGDDLGCPVQLLNDVRTATLGELKSGHGKDDPRVSMVFFSIGTGIGGGIVLDGKMRLGPLGAAGEIGHQTVDPNGPRCGCGNRGCLEAIASGPAMTAAGVRLMLSGLAPDLYQRTGGDPKHVNPQTMGLAATQDPSVHEAIVDAAEAIGIAAANVVTTLHPQLIVLGGGVAEMGSLLTDTVAKMIHQRVCMFPTDDIRVEKSALGEHAGLMGAIALAMDAAGQPLTRSVSTVQSNSKPT